MTIFARQFFFWYWMTWTNHIDHWKTSWQKVEWFQLFAANFPSDQFDWFKSSNRTKSHHTKNPRDIYRLVERRLNCWKSLLSKKFICLNLELSWLMLISWTKLLFMLKVNKRKIQTSLNPYLHHSFRVLGLRENVPPQLMKLMPLTALRHPNVAMWTHLPLQACNILL